MSGEEVIERVGALHDSFEQALADCRDQVLTKTELQRTIYDAREELKRILEPGSRAHRTFDRLSQEAGSYSVRSSGTSYVPPKDCEQAQKWLDITLAVLREVDPSTDAIRRMNQFALPAGEGYANFRKVLQVMKSAESKLTVVDPYLDSEVFTYLDEIPDSISIRLITGPTPKRTLTTLLAALRPSRANVEGRAASGFHDRFLLIDDDGLWQLGCSLNGIGKSTSMLSRVTEATERARLLMEIEKAWSAGSPA